MTIPSLSFFRIARQLTMDADLLLHFCRQGRRSEIVKALHAYASRHGNHPLLTALELYLTAAEDVPKPRPTEGYAALPRHSRLRHGSDFRPEGDDIRPHHRSHSGRQSR